MTTIEDLLWEQGRRKDWLARQIRIHPSYLSKLLSGERSWTLKMKARVAEALSVPVDDIFFGSGARRNEQNESEIEAVEAVAVPVE